jgi:hypothetical protein
MTAKALAAAIDKKGLYHVNGLHVEVIVIDAKFVYGTVRFQVTPVRGSGLIWVEETSVTLNSLL